jgi:hypothetical protein
VNVLLIGRDGLAWCTKNPLASKRMASQVASVVLLDKGDGNKDIPPHIEMIAGTISWKGGSVKI